MREIIISKETDSYIRAPLYIIVIFPILYIILGTSYFVTLAMVAAVVVVTFLYGISYGIAAYIFIGIWETYTTLPFSSGAAIVSIFLALFILFSKIKNNNYKLIPFQFLFLVITGIQSIYSLFLYGELSVITMLTDLIIAFEVVSISKSGQENRYWLWRNIFYFLFISSIFSVIWGAMTYLSGDVATVYLNGLYIPRMRAVIGTDRTCMLYCAAMIYPMFYESDKKRRYFFCAIFLLCILMTLSATALVCTAAFFSIKIWFELKTQGNTKKIKIFFVVIVLMLWIIYCWIFGSNIPLVDTMFQRVHKIVNLVNNGEVGSATSGRSEIWNSYMNVFYRSSASKKMFGTGVLNYYYTGNFLKYAHNSYIDMLLYMGIIPLIVFFLYAFYTCKIFKKNNYQEYIPLLMVKIVYILTAVAVSAFPSINWWIWVII